MKVDISLSLDAADVEALGALAVFLNAVSGNASKMVASNEASTEKPQKVEKLKVPKSGKTVETETRMPGVVVEPKEEEEGQSEGGILTLEILRALVNEKKQHREAIRAKLDEFGAANTPSLDPSKWQEYADFLRAL